MRQRERDERIGPSPLKRTQGCTFERYTEKARRVIFFARYEANQFGTPYIETEHLLLGLLRENNALAYRVLQSAATVGSVREQIERHHAKPKKVITAVDLPLSHESKRVLVSGFLSRFHSWPSSST